MRISPTELLSYMRAPDTLDRMESASVCRLEEARKLRAIGHGFWAIYTFGYVVELCLKAAFLRLAGLERHEDAGSFLKGVSRDWARALDVARRGGNLHDLLFWYELIVAERSFARRPMEGETSREYATRIQQVATSWRPDMRYHPSVVIQERTVRVAAASAWIFTHQSLLWS